MEKVLEYEILKALARRHQLQNDFFLTHVKNGPTYINRGLLILDAVAIKKSWSKPCITGYEVKVNRNDFLNDEKWVYYLKYCHRFYFVCPVGLIKPEELKETIGLIYYDPDKKTLSVKRKAVFQPLPSLPVEMLYYVILSRLDPERDPFFGSKKQFFKDWLEHKIDSQKLGYKVGCELAKKINRLERKVKILENDLRIYKETERLFRKVLRVLERNGITIPPSWLEIDKFCEELDKNIKTRFPSPEQTEVFLLVKRFVEELEHKQIFLSTFLSCKNNERRIQTGLLKINESV